jgi:hypothetical protein
LANATNLMPENLRHWGWATARRSVIPRETGSDVADFVASEAERARQFPQAALRNWPTLGSRPSPADER